MLVRPRLPRATPLRRSRRRLDGAKGTPVLGVGHRSRPAIAVQRECAATVCTGYRYVTENKSLKRRVRERMSKTGERYTSARRQLLAKSDPPVLPVTSHEPPHGPTSNTLTEWFAVLDEWGARDRRHAEIARWLGAEKGVPPWWTQDITVRYERHIGRRVVGQRVDSTFSATGTKTIAVAPDVARAAWTDENVRRRWLPDVRLIQRPNRARAAARFDVNDGEGRLIVSFDPRGDERTMVAIEHEKLTDQAQTKRWSALWRERLKALKEMLEHGI